jgi:hypothetical protein
MLLHTSSIDISIIPLNTITSSKEIKWSTLCTKNDLVRKEFVSESIYGKLVFLLFSSYNELIRLKLFRRLAMRYYYYVSNWRSKLFYVFLCYVKDLA